MATYSDEFKSQAVHLLYKLKKEGTVQVDSDLNVNNVRELVAFLDISSYSLYKWQKNFEYEGNLGDEEIEVFTKDIAEKDFIEELVELDNDLKDFTATKQELEEQNGIDLLAEQMKDIGYWQSLARALGLKNYRQKTPQLKLRIGMELINGNSLVESNVRKELKIE